MRQLVIISRFLVVTLTIAALMVSCSSSKYAGYGYRPNSKAPDIASGNETAVRTKNEIKLQEASSSEDKIVAEATEKMNKSLSSEEKDKFKKIDEAFHNELNEQRKSGEITSNRELMHTVTKKLTDEGTIEKLTPSQEKKLDKLTLKMDKKVLKQGKEIDATHNTNLELFFLIMAVAGLVLGILGVWLGWLLLVVFGGLWLYYKLVRD
jgi:membrane-associated HD superfamily phosphohydrolase